MTKLLAKAKINLFLNIIGKDHRNYHLLESLAVFTDDVYDEITISHSDYNQLEISGEFSYSVPSDDSNLIIKAIKLLEISSDYNIKLQKNIPIAAGLGGGSADAAAVMRYIIEINKLSLDFKQIENLCSKIGSDISICYLNQSCYFNSTGLVEKSIKQLPEFYVILVNCKIPLSTPEMYKNRRGEFTDTLTVKPGKFTSLDGFVSFLKLSNNDLFQPALETLPLLSDIIAHIEKQRGCLLARMSGSGATCFGLFANPSSAENARNNLQQLFPNWWIKTSRVS